MDMLQCIVEKLENKQEIIGINESNMAMVWALTLYFVLYSDHEQHWTQQVDQARSIFTIYSD